MIKILIYKQNYTIKGKITFQQKSWPKNCVDQQKEFHS